MSKGLCEHNQRVLRTTSPSELQVLIQRPSDSSTYIDGFYPHKGVICVKKIPLVGEPYFSTFNGNHRKTVVVKSEVSDWPEKLLPADEVEELVEAGLVVRDNDGDLVFLSKEPIGGERPWTIIKTSLGLLFVRARWGNRIPEVFSIYEYIEIKSAHDQVCELGQFMYDNQRPLTDIELKRAYLKLGYFDCKVEFSSGLKVPYMATVNSDYVTAYPTAIEFTIKLK